MQGVNTDTSTARRTGVSRPAASPDEVTILVVEDDSTLLRTLAWNLNREGYRVLTASDGEAGLEVIRSESDALDLILLDVMLPGMSGFHVLRHTRQGSMVPVIMLTARGEEQDRIDGLELGADDYVIKPFALRELLARVRANLRRRSIPSVRPPAILHRGPIQIEPERRRARVHDTELRLRPKEFGLLVALAMEPGRVFGRQQLLDEVWGEEIVIDERTVDVHVSWLRTKLSEAGLKQEMIQTVYGAGYRFVVPESVNGGPAVRQGGPPNP